MCVLRDEEAREREHTEEGRKAAEALRLALMMPPTSTVQHEYSYSYSTLLNVRVQYFLLQQQQSCVHQGEAGTGLEVQHDVVPLVRVQYSTLQQHAQH